MSSSCSPSVKLLTCGATSSCPSAVSNALHSAQPDRGDAQDVHDGGTCKPEFENRQESRGVAIISKENEELFIGDSEEEDEEVFFGVVASKEKSKMAKLRRRTEVFVANFRNMSWSGTESLDGTRSTSSSLWSHDSSVSSSSFVEAGSPARCQTPHQTAATPQHPKPFVSITASSVIAHRAATKIQTWFRLTRQAHKHQGILSEEQRLETNDLIQEIRKEERIRLRSTPEQGLIHKGAKLDAAQRSPLIIFPSHIPGVVETSPQQSSVAIGQQQSPSPARLCQDDPSITEIVFNASNGKSGVSRTPEIALADCDTARLGESFSKFSTDPETQRAISKPRSESTVKHVTSMQENCATPKLHVLQSYQNQVNALGSTSRPTSFSSTTALYHGAYTKVASTLTSHSFCNQSLSLHDAPLKLDFTIGSTINSPMLQVHKSSASYTPLRQLQLNTVSAPSSFAKVDYDQIQSPTVFSSPRLFPMTVQAVQSQSSVPSAVLFSPHKIPERKPAKGNHYSDSLTSQSFATQVTRSRTPMKSAEKENNPSSHPFTDKLVFNFDPRQHGSETPTHNTVPLINSADCAKDPVNKITTTSVPVDNFPMSPNVSVGRSVQKVAIVTPHPAQSPLTTSGEVGSTKVSGCKATPTTCRGPGQGLTKSQELMRSHRFFPSPVVMVKGTPETMTSLTPKLSSRDQHGSKSEAATGQLGAMTSPHVGPRSSESARGKLQLLEQKRAELARLRAEKAELKQTLKTENEMCRAMKQEVQLALRSNTSQTNIPVHLLSLGCQGISSLTLTDQELDMVTRLHTIRNSHCDGMQGLTASPMVSDTSQKESVHLRWHSSLVTEVQRLSSPGHPSRVARPILAKRACKARRITATRTASPARRVHTSQVRPCNPSGLTQTPRHKLAF